MATALSNGLSLHARDVTGQKTANVSDVPADATVGELIQGLVSRMGLPANDVQGRPLNYHARLEREGRHLRSSETCGEALHEEDQLTLQPHITAG